MTSLSGFYRGKRVFITGHTGFKGSWLCAILGQMGAEVCGYALPAPTEPNLWSMLDHRPIRSIEGDVRDLEFLKKSMASFNPDIAFHLAAQPLVRLSYKDPAGTYGANVIGTVNFFEAVRASILHGGLSSVVNVTTDKVYENKEWLWGYREDERLCGYDPYSNSKSCSELVTYSYKNSFFGGEDSPAISTARSGNVIGGGDFSADRIIPDCIRSAQKHEPIVVRNPHSTRPYQHVLECLNGYLLLAMKQCQDKSLAGAYNFGPDDESCVTTGKLAGLFCAAWGDGMTWIDRSDGGPHEASFLKLDCSKSKARLGWKPRWNIAAAVEKTVAAAQAYGDIPALQAQMNCQIAEYFSIGKGEKL